MAENDDIAIISGVDEEPVVENVDDKVKESSEEDIVDSDEEMEEEEEYIKASRYSFDLTNDKYIFDFKDVDPESEEENEENDDENNENDDNEEDEEEDNEKDGMEEDITPEEEMTEQQQMQAEREARDAVQKNVTRRMGWFDMLRRLEKKVVNEKKMAQSGGYDLSDPFIDDGNLASQTTTIFMPEPPPFQVMRYNASEANEGKSSTDHDTHNENKRRRKGEKIPLTDKQKEQLAKWKPSARVTELLDSIREKATALFADSANLNQMPSDLDDLLSELDIEATKGLKSRPSVLVIALTDIFPFHPQTIKSRLRLLQLRRENNEIESQYATQKQQFLDFMREWAATCTGTPEWTVETKMKMMEIYSLLRDRIDKHLQLMKSEHVDSILDFDTEFTNLTSTVLSYFNVGTLTIVDLQREFETAAHDEELCLIAEDNKSDEDKHDEDEDIAVISEIPEEAHDKTIELNQQQVDIATTEKTAVKSRLTSPKMVRVASKQEDKDNNNMTIHNMKGIQVNHIKGHVFKTVQFSSSDFA